MEEGKEGATRERCLEGIRRREDAAVDRPGNGQAAVNDNVHSAHRQQEHQYPRGCDHRPASSQARSPFEHEDA